MNPEDNPAYYQVQLKEIWRSKQFSDPIAIKVYEGTGCQILNSNPGHLIEVGDFT